MADRERVLDRGVAGIDPAPDSYDRVLRRVRRRRARRRVGVGLLAAVLFAGAAGGLWLGFFSGPPPRPATHGPVRPEVTARTFLAQGVAGGIAVGDGSVWVPERTVLVRLDPVTLRPTATVRLPGPPDDSRRIAFGAGAVWVTGIDRLLRVDPATDRVAFSFPVGTVWSLAVGQGAVWISHLGPPFTLTRIDAATNEMHSFQVSTSLSKWFGLAAGLGSVWTSNAGGTTCPAAGCLVELDPSSGRVRSTVQGVSGFVALGRGAVWVSMAWEVDRFDPGTGRVTARVHLPGKLHELGAIAASSDYVWTAAGSDLVVIDARTNRLLRSPFPVGASPYAVAASGSTAWVTSEGGVVVRVQLVPCRGNACRVAPSPPPTPAGGAAGAISQVRMVSPTLGWAVADVPGRGLSILHTANGGTTWTDVGPVRGRDYYEVFPFFLGPSHAWFGTARHRVVTIYRTADGGRTWGTSTLRTAEPGGPLWFVSPEDGWFLAGGHNGTMGREPLEVFRTTDGGSHWERISVSSDAAPTSAPGPLSNGCDKGDIVFTDTHTGFVNVFCNSAGDVLFVTHDGGVTWLGQTLPGLSCPEGCGASAPEFVTSEVGFVQAVLGAGSLYVTHDGGATWTPLPQPPAPFGLPDFVDPSHGFAWANGRLYVTADGGQAWTAIRPGVDLSNAAVDFVDARAGFAVVQGARYVLRTVDGGHTWQKVPALLVP